MLLSETSDFSVCNEGSDSMVVSFVTASNKENGGCDAVGGGSEN